MMIAPDMLASARDCCTSSTKWEGRVAQHLGGGIDLELMRVAREHAGDFGRQGRVDEYPRVLDGAITKQRGEVEQQLLRPFERKSGNEQIAATVERLFHLQHEAGAACFDRHVRAVAIAVGRLGHDEIHPAWRFRRPDQGIVVRPEIARKEQSHIGDMDFDRGRPQHMARIPQARLDTRTQDEVCPEFDRTQLREQRLRVGGRV